MLESCLAALEGGTHGFAFASGSAASLTLLHTLRPGDHVVSGDDVYGGTYRQFDKVLKPMGIETTFLDLRDVSQVEAAFRPETKLLWLESPSNPTLKVFDIAALVKAARHASIPKAQRVQQQQQCQR